MRVGRAGEENLGGLLREERSLRAARTNRSAERATSGKSEGGKSQLPFLLCGVFVFNVLKEFQMYRKLKVQRIMFISSFTCFFSALSHICFVISLTLQGRTIHFINLF